MFGILDIFYVILLMPQVT